jgi:hypothetical protein
MPRSRRRYRPQKTVLLVCLGFLCWAGIFPSALHEEIAGAACLGGGAVCFSLDSQHHRRQLPPKRRESPPDAVPGPWMPVTSRRSRRRR